MGGKSIAEGRPAPEQPPEEWNCVHVSLAAWTLGPECREEIGPLHQLQSLQEMRGSIAESPWPGSHCIQMWSCNFCSFEVRRRVPASLASRALLTNTGLKAH